jgi:hypothetical protein
LCESDKSKISEPFVGIFLQGYRLATEDEKENLPPTEVFHFKSYPYLLFVKGAMSATGYAYAQNG